jgi:hypothetical protein
MAQVVECLPSKCEALNSNPISIKKTKPRTWWQTKFLSPKAADAELSPQNRMKREMGGGALSPLVLITTLLIFARHFLQHYQPICNLYFINQIW